MVVMSNCITEIDDILKMEKSSKAKIVYPTVKEENDSNMVEITGLTSVILALEGKNAKNQYINKTKVQFCQCGLDYPLELFRELEIQWKIFDVVIRYWIINFILASTCLVFLVLLLYFKEYQSQKKCFKNDDYVENCYSQTNFDYRQIQQP